MAGNGHSFTLDCSSREFHSIRTDALCKEESVPLTDPLEHFTVKDEVDTEITSDEPSFSYNNLEGTKTVWLDSSTTLLVSLVEEMSPKIGKTFSLHTKKKMWQAICARMAEQGYDFSVAQVEAKYRGLERQYKKTMSRNKETGSNQICQYQQQIETILSNRKGTSADFLLDEHTSSLYRVEMMDQEVLEELPPKAAISAVTFSNPSFPLVQSDDDSRSQAPRKKPSIAGILKELKESRAERKAFHTKVLQYLQNKEEREERMEERAERKEERDIRKLELLERLARMKQK